MKGILAKIQKAWGKQYCFFFSILFFILAFALIFVVLIGSWNDMEKGASAVASLFSFICGILLLAAGLYDPGPDESVIKPPRFFTLNEDGDVVLTEISASPPLTEKEKAEEKPQNEE